jgi:hypothetical protein
MSLRARLHLFPTLGVATFFLLSALQTACSGSAIDAESSTSDLDDAYRYGRTGDGHGYGYGYGYGYGHHCGYGYGYGYGR